MAKNKKAFVSPKTKGLEKTFNQSNLKSKHISRQYLCSFCWRELPNNSVRFKGIGACPKCFKLSHLFVDSLRAHQREYSKRLEVKK